MTTNVELLLNLSALHRNVFKNIDRHLSVHGISFSEFLVMYELSLATNRTVRRVDLAESVGMSASGITRLLNPMEKMKIVEKEQSARDARVSFVKLSDAGSTLLKDAMKSVEQAAKGIFDPLDDDEVTLLLRLAGKLK